MTAKLLTKTIEEPFFIFKKIIKYDEYDVFKREVFMLQYLKNHEIDWAPTLISYDEEQKIMQMNYCGEPAISEIVANPAQQLQIKNILEDMKRLENTTTIRALNCIAALATEHTLITSNTKAFR